MESRARSQSNLVVRQITGFPRIERFSNMIIPMFWAEYVSTSSKIAINPLISNKIIFKTLNGWDEERKFKFVIESILSYSIRKTP